MLYIHKQLVGSTENDCAVFIGVAQDQGQGPTKEVQIVYRLFLENCYLLHVPRLPPQPASNVGDLVIYVTGLNWLDST